MSPERLNQYPEPQQGSRTAECVSHTIKAKKRCHSGGEGANTSLYPVETCFTAKWTQQNLPENHHLVFTWTLAALPFYSIICQNEYTLKRNLPTADITALLMRFYRFVLFKWFYFSPQNVFGYLIFRLKSNIKLNIEEQKAFLEEHLSIRTANHVFHSSFKGELRYF